MDDNMTIRLMDENDADIVSNIDALAFGAWFRQVKGEAAKLPQRKRIHILALLEKEPEGCFIAKEGDREVGFIFSRTWGSVGWFGTFAVLPEYQGSDIGKRLIAASLDYLRRDPKRVIGLETQCLPDHSDCLIKLACETQDMSHKCMNLGIIGT